MLQFKIKEILLASGIKNPSKYLIKAGLSKQKASGFVHNTQKTYSSEDISRICHLLNCTPNDLQYWQNTPRITVPPTHPLLTELQPAPTHANWLDLVGQVPKDKAVELHAQLQKMIEDMKNNGE
jgi:DNA-binding Xre family transcriptional regulator